MVTKLPLVIINALPYNCRMKPEISVIVCTQKPPEDTLHRRNVEKTSGDAAVEYIAIDNRTNAFGLGAAYNRGVQRASGEILVFMHDDVYFAEGDWGGKLVAKFMNPDTGLIGVAGTSYLFADNPGWVVAGRPYIHGQVIHELNGGALYNLTVFSWEKKDCEVVAVDGLFFAIRRSLFDHISFDEETFDAFHFYDLDICMQVRHHARCYVTRDILVKHTSGGSFDEVWKKYALRFLQKYQRELPASCTSTIPDTKNRAGFENFDLRGKVPQITIS